jgi:DNA modification methylase
VSDEERSTDKEIAAWTNQIHEGDALAVLNELPESSIHTCVTSPPFWGLRDYGHDDQLGLEPTVEEYVDQLVTVGQKLRRVLRDDGSWWLNLGDTFAGGGGIAGKPDDWDDLHDDETYPDDPPAKRTRFERKTKLLVPHRVAIALIDAGWIVRSDAVWTKPDPMPSSVKDQFNETKEFVFHLTPQPDYWFDLDSVREPHKDSSFDRSENGYQDTKTRATDHLPNREGTERTHNFDSPLHPNGKNPGDVFDVPVAQCPEAHYAVFPSKLIETPIKATCPPTVCAACGTPYDRESVEKPVTLDMDAEAKPERPQLQRAREIARQAGLTDEHLQACRAVGFSDAGAGKACQTGAGSNTERIERLAAEAKDVLGGYFREFCGTRRVSEGWTSVCECDTDETRPGIVLDPFAGMGTTCHVAKRLGRRFVGIELNEEYVALAQQRCGLDVDDPDLLTDDGQRGLAAFTDGGERQ